MGVFYWPNYVHVERPYQNSQVQVYNDILNALNNLSGIPEFRTLVKECKENNGWGYTIVPSDNGNTSLSQGDILISASEDKAEFLGKDGAFHEFSMEMTILHEMFHKMDSFVLPDNNNYEYGPMEQIDNHRRQINAKLRKYGLDPIKSSDTDEQKFLKAVQAEEIRVIERVNEISAKYYPGLPLRDPIAHEVIDSSKVRFSEGENGWEDAFHKTPSEDTVTSLDIKNMLQRLSIEDLNEAFGNDATSHDISYLWELANENNNHEDFSYHLGYIIEHNPELGQKILDVYKGQEEQASLDVQTTKNYANNYTSNVPPITNSI